MADTIVKGKTEAEVVADLALKQVRGVEIVNLTMPDGSKVELIVQPMSGGGSALVPVKPLLEPYRTAPERKVGTAHLVDLDSFCEFANRHKDDDSVLFLTPDREHPKLLAVFDYHRKGERNAVTLAGAPRFLSHRAVYEFPVADEWEDWNGQDGKPMNQEAFAAWIEDHILDLMDPINCGDSAKAFAQKLDVPLATPAKLVALSRGLSVYAGFQMSKVVNLATGEAQMTFAEEHKDAAGAPLMVPGAFIIAIPAFQGGDRFQLPVRLRYRVVPGARQVVWSFELYNPASVLDTALGDAARIATQETGLPLYRGSPEQ